MAMRTVVAAARAGTTAPTAAAAPVPVVVVLGVRIGLRVVPDDVSATLDVPPPVTITISLALLALAFLSRETALSPAGPLAAGLVFVAVFLLLFGFLLALVLLLLVCPLCVGVYRRLRHLSLQRNGKLDAVNLATVHTICSSTGVFSIAEYDVRRELDDDSVPPTASTAVGLYVDVAYLSKVTKDLLQMSISDAPCHLSNAQHSFGLQRLQN